MDDYNDKMTARDKLLFILHTFTQAAQVGELDKRINDVYDPSLKASIIASAYDEIYKLRDLQFEENMMK